MLKTVSSVASALGALNYKGTWNATTNTPTLASGVGTQGDYYVVSVAGTTNLDGITNWGVGDWAAFNGSVWQRVEGGADGNFDNLTALGTSTLTGNVQIVTGDLTVSAGYVSSAGLRSITDGTNNFVAGVTAGDSIIAGGNNNTLIGDNAGTAITASNNTAIGYSSLGSNIGASNTGNENTALGAYSLFANTTASSNTAVGYASLGSNMTGVSNVAAGHNTLAVNTGGSYNTAIGTASLGSNISASANAAVGSNSLAANISGSSNTALGALSLDANTTASNNTAVGTASLGANITGTQNVALGAFTLDANTTASSSTAIGYSSLGASTGAQNTALGASTGSTVTTGSNLTLVGYNAEPSSATATNEVTLGDTNVATFRCQVALTVLSDERDKAQIAPINECLDFVNDLDIKSFIMSERNSEETQGEVRTGLLAQDLLAVIEKHNIAGTDDLVKSDNPDRLEVTTSDLIFPLIKAVQELSQQVKQLQQKGE